MSLCASCGLSVTGDSRLCPHHHMAYEEDWATANRIMCDFFHRAIVPKRLPVTERDEMHESFWEPTAPAASEPDYSAA